MRTTAEAEHRVPGATVPRGAGTDWLVVARDGPAVRLPELAPTVRCRLLTDGTGLDRLLTAEHPRLVVLASPPAGAAELRTVARHRRTRSSLRAVLLDAPEAVEERLLALELGFDDALADTVEPRELHARLVLLAGGARPRRDRRRIVLGPGLELDLVGRQLLRDGRDVHLRPREFDLLAFLARHPGRAHSRRQLLDRIWGSRPGVSPRNVDVHVRWLREKLEPTPDRPAHLVTVRGIGYRLDVEPAVPADR
ncbi:MAG TPA: response regulator transcription factor [Candidatus Limnocylindrales bacterium]